jgi:hypothetical protein
MTRFTSGGKPVSFQPRHASRPSSQHPGRREAIHGRIQGLPDRRRPRLSWSLVAVVFAVLTFGLSLLMGVAS